MKIKYNNTKQKISTKLYIYFMVLIYPLIFHNFYFDIVTVKYIAFLVATGLLIICDLLLEGENEEKLSIISYLKRLSITDWLVTAFVIINIISTLISENPIYAINGADGRNVGLITMLLLGSIYFIISRTYEHDERFVVLVTVGSLIVGILGIINSFNIDFIGFYDELEYFQKVNYVSTLGHIDVYTNYFAISLPIILWAYLNADSMKKMIFYFISLIINMTGVMAGHCNSAYIILGIGFVSVLVFSKWNLRKLILPIYLWILLGKILITINDNLKEPREVTGIGRNLFSDKSVMAATIIFALVVIFYNFKKTEIKEKFVNFIKMAGIFIIILPIIYMLGILLFTYVFKDIPLGNLEDVLRITDESGSYRGYIWRVVISEFGELDLPHKLFGIGTDSLRPYLVKRYGEEMYNVTNAYYDNAHNELLQYLITIGILGLVSYIGIIICSIRNSLRNNSNIMFAPVLITYFVQSLVNINQVVTLPILFIIIALCNTKLESGYR